MSRTRRNKIIEILSVKGNASVNMLKNSLEVSDMTIRRDLKALEQKGLIKRTHGGASFIDGANKAELSSTMGKDYPHAQDIIATEAISFVQDKDTIGLGAGSVITAFSKKISDFSLTVVTTSINAAINMLEGPSIVYISGGRIDAKHRYLYGDVSERGYDNFYVDKLFITSAGLNMQGMISELEDREARIKRLMIRRAKKVYLLLEAERFNITKFYSVASICDIHCIVTDIKPSDEYMKLFSDYNIEVVYVK